MVASAADDGVAPTVAEASAKLLASPEVDELEADYAKRGYCLAAGLLGEDNLGKIHRDGPKFGPTLGLYYGISSQTVWPTCELWATLVNFRLRDPADHTSSTDRARPGG
jgi:hypothetical protein